MCFSVTWYGFFAYTDFESSDAAIEAMNNQFLMNKCITAQYAFKKEGKGERHGTAAERLFAAQARKNNVLHVNARLSSTHGPVRCTAAHSRLPRTVPGPVRRCTGGATSTAQVHTSASTRDARDGCAWWCVNGNITAAPAPVWGMFSPGGFSPSPLAGFAPGPGIPQDGTVPPPLPMQF